MDLAYGPTEVQYTIQVVRINTIYQVQHGEQNHGVDLRRLMADIYGLTEVQCTIRVTRIIIICLVQHGERKHGMDLRQLHRFTEATFGLTGRTSIIPIAELNMF